MAKFPLKKNYPKEIKFYDKVYKVKFIKTLESREGASGQCNKTDKTIKLQDDLGREERLSTFIHELLHMIEFEAPIKIKHKMVHQLEAAIYELIIRNFL